MPPATWQFDERAHAGPEHLDADYVAGYDRKAGTDPSADVQLLRDAGVHAESVVVDLGAGTGTFATAIAPHCSQVVAVDVSRPMLDALRERCRVLGVHNVRCIEAGFLSYEHEGRAADAVYSRNALHHLPDFWKAIALERVAGLLAPGGVLRLRDLVYSFEPAETEAALERWFSGASATSDLGWTRAELEEHVRTEYSPFSWVLEPMLERCGFEIGTTEHAPTQTYSAYTCARI
ncbi:MAG TPA: class I SAM-dependent methyltransferase [Acidimicrobiia bacterium]|jgi:ubiquinone/menaquinone biosynthesis C-methylase UbiE|nr:class I SAM-dependent methyltransferase [Acidimicrobiia bacterium]